MISYRWLLFILPLADIVDQNGKLAGAWKERFLGRRGCQIAGARP